jgi:lipooligosaccharide transport system ATP-binding protein
VGLGVPVTTPEERSEGPVVAARDLVKTYGGAAAVDGVSFSIAPGICFGILGPNGAGKTTTIRMTYGFTPRTAGELLVFGLDVERHPREVKSRIGVCQQQDSLDPDLSVEANLRVFASYFDIPAGKAAERAAELLDFIGLSHRRDAPVAALSGGMARRLMIARALVNDPRLLILDEPTTGLDPQSRHQVWERLQALKAAGLTILLTTHYMDEAQRLCDRLVIMDQGKILVEGKPAELVRRHAGGGVIEVEEPDDRLRSWVVKEGLDHEDLGHRLIVYSEQGERLFRTISEGYCTTGCNLRMATLEDVFLRLTGRGLRE